MVENADWPIIEASRQGRADVVATLVAQGEDLNVRSFCDCSERGATALFLACDAGHIEVARVLVRAGAGVDKPKMSGATPLWAASHRGRTELVALLLQGGAKVDAQADNGTSPLYMAIHEGHLACVQLLASHGAPRSLDRFPHDVCALAELRGYAHIHDWLKANPPVDHEQRRDHSKLKWRAVKG
jgi:ankyrin repeat protein